MKDGETTIYKIINKTKNRATRNPTKNRDWTLTEKAVPLPHVVPVVLLFLQSRRLVNEVKIELWIDSQERQYTNFPIVSFPFICNSILATLACELYICQLIRYSWAYCCYHDVNDRELLLTMKLLNQGFLFFLQSRRLVNEVKIELWLRQAEHKNCLLQRNSVAVIQVMVVTIKLSKWWLLLNK
jgi:hypothetical protein